MSALASLMSLAVFIVLVTIVAVIIVGIVRIIYSPRVTGTGDRAKAILRECYARGEISRTEYLERLHDLS